MRRNLGHFVGSPFFLRDWTMVNWLVPPVFVSVASKGFSVSVNGLESTLNTWALLTSCVRESMHQAVNVVGQAEEQGLADLRGQAAPRGARGELAFDGGESTIDGIVLQPPQKAIQRGVVGHRWQVQCGAQF